MAYQAPLWLLLVAALLAGLWRAVMHVFYPLVAATWIGEYFRYRREGISTRGGGFAVIAITLWGVVSGGALIQMSATNGLSSSGAVAAGILYALGLLAFLWVMRPRKAWSPRSR